MYIARSSGPEVFFEKAVLKRFCKSHKKTPVPELLFNNVIKKETVAQTFFCAFWKVFKNSFFIGHLRWLLLHCLQSGEVDIKNEDVVQ